ncbi:hypothetical protein FOZG_02694 [Fusarium oxysporum Fo47]|uniref:Uncharacterized protein n=1 Tax=Fusarium oxysporum Fo47 TaxID=660027 RepID=W9KQ50_FUSOX|nr:hypothetical protein FOZG_02694 [Fusarium oxysporum Fo47]
MTYPTQVDGRISSFHQLDMVAAQNLVDGYANGVQANAHVQPINQTKFCVCNTVVTNRASSIVDRSAGRGACGVGSGRLFNDRRGSGGNIGCLSLCGTLDDSGCQVGGAFDDSRG